MLHALCFVRLVRAYKPDSVFHRSGVIIIYLGLMLLLSSSVFPDKIGIQTCTKQGLPNSNHC